MTNDQIFYAILAVAMLGMVTWSMWKSPFNDNVMPEDDDDRR